MKDPLALFHPLIARWFRERVGTPTPAQASAWPAIARGEHVLVTAPTGSGKTMAAFLWALDQLIAGKWEGGRTRVVYISPLKALNNDIQRNLLAPLEALREVFRQGGTPFPDVRVETRSGDTPQSARQRMLRRPPEILITTPESLNLLLSSKSGRSILDSLATVILDEIHTVVSGKRGVHLITAVERLVPLSGEFQRIAMSATVKPMEVVAEFVGGFRLEAKERSRGGERGRNVAKSAGETRYVSRPVTIVEARADKVYELNVVRPADDGAAAAANDGSEGGLWPSLVREFRGIIDRNRSSLFFVRSRRASEALAFRINGGEPAPLAYSHHGSLSKELRLDVETKLKSGALRAIVATNSLELGIDIGALDEVVLVQSPPSIASAVQRIGRAGHRVGAASRGTFFPTHDQDIVESAVIAKAVREGDIEAACPVENALDVLAQVLLSMVGTETWDIDALYDGVRASWPYRRLPRAQFDLVLEMLAGRYAHTRIRELKPKISIDRLDNTAAARPGALLSLFLSGGTIPDRGYYHLRHEETGALIGELDEEFVWEARPGQNFAFGTQYWTIRRITHNEVFALPVRLKSAEAPFWKAEAFNRNAHLSDRIAAFMDEADRKVDDPTWPAELEREFGLDGRAADALVTYLKRQKAETGAPLPGARRLVVEHVRTGPDGYPGNQIILHTLWGGRLNRPFALALDAAWEERHGYRLEMFTGDDSIVLQLPQDVEAGELLGLVHPGNIESLLRSRLESSGYFGARFRENAGRALLLTRYRAGERLPLWMSRLRSQKLLQAVMGLPDFPILLETWRTCLRDEFDLEALKMKIGAVASGAVEIVECLTDRPSPLARNMTFGQLNTYMYAGDELPVERRSRLRGELLREVVFSPGLRPAVSRETVRRFEEKRQRLSPGYAPAPDRNLVDWVKERVVLPWPEWERLLEAVARDRAAEATAENQDEAGGETRSDDSGAEGYRTPSECVSDVDRLVAVQREAAEAKRMSSASERRKAVGSGGGPALEAASRLVRVTVGPEAHTFVCALERLPDIERALWPGLKIDADSIAGGAVDPALRDAAYAAAKPAEEDADSLLMSLLAEWLQAYGPVRAADVCRDLSLGPARLDLALEDLRDAEGAIEGPLIKGEDGDLVCDAENYEILLRLERAALAPTFEPREIQALPLFLARVQGLVPGFRDGRETAEEKAFRAVERLAGLPLPASLWEAEVLPARVTGYATAQLDFALGQADLRWQGRPGGAVRFLFERDAELVRPENGSVEAPLAGTEIQEADGEARQTDSNKACDPESGAIPSPVRSTGSREVSSGSVESEPSAGAPAALFADPSARYDFATLLNRAGGDFAALEQALWNGVWSGALTNTTWSAIRRGLETKFQVGAVIERQERSLAYAPRRESLRLAAWRQAQAYPGAWLLLPEPPPAAEDDPVEREEVRKERVRLLLDRYGILFKELLAREVEPFRWPDIFRTLRLMELSGEVLSGYFFKGVPGPQFMSPAAFRVFLEERRGDDVFWICAVDPASACGLPLEGLRGALPKRVEGTHLVYRGENLALVSQRNGRSLEFLTPPDDTGLGDCLILFDHLLGRAYAPLRRVVIETINGGPSPASPYLPAFRARFDAVVDIKRVSLFRRVRGH